MKIKSFALIIVFLVQFQIQSQIAPRKIQFEVLSSITNAPLSFVNVLVYDGAKLIDSLQTDYYGVLNIDSIKYPNVITVKFYRDRKECDCNIYSKEFKLNLDTVSNTKAINVQLSKSGNSHCVGEYHVFYFHPFSTDCYLNLEYEQAIYSASKILDKCECFHADNCEYLRELIQYLKCDQNITIEILGGCSDSEYAQNKNALVAKRVQKVENILAKSGITNYRVKTTLLGNAKHIYNEKEIKLKKSNEEKLYFEARNTYVKILIKSPQKIEK